MFNSSVNAIQNFKVDHDGYFSWRFLMGKSFLTIGRIFLCQMNLPFLEAYSNFLESKHVVASKPYDDEMNLNWGIQ